MIRHCVFIRFRPDVTEDEKRRIASQIAALQPHLPGMRAVHAGRNVSPETGMDKGFSDGFIVDFDDAVARDLYLADEEHRRIGAGIVAAAAGGVAGVFVYDLDLAERAA